MSKTFKKVAPAKGTDRKRVKVEVEETRVIPNEVTLNVMSIEKMDDQITSINEQIKYLQGREVELKADRLAIIAAVDGPDPAGVSAL